MNQAQDRPWRSVWRALGLAVLVAGVGIAFPYNATADPISVAVVHVGVDNTGVFGISNALSFLSHDHRFASVSGIDADSGVPSAAVLSGFDAVMVVSDNRSGVITNGRVGTQLGNQLHSYVQQGGHLVMTSFTSLRDIGVDGAIVGDLPYSLGSGNASAGALDIAHAARAHPVFNGVSSFESSWASSLTVSNGGTLLASYLSGTPAVVTNAANSIMFINGFPGAESDYRNGSDFGRLFANALAIPNGAVSPTPEPASLVLVVLGGAAAIVRRRRRTDS